MERVEWTDARMDDLARLVYANDARLDYTDRLADKHDQDLKQLAVSGDRRNERHFQLWLIALGSLGTNIGILITLATQHVH